MNANTINSTILTDEEMELPVVINYSYKSFLLADTVVFDVSATVEGTTITPDYILKDQIEIAIRELHNSKVRFEDSINLTFK